MTSTRNIPEGHYCPLCFDHQDDDFVWDDLLGTYVCLGCSHEINNGFDSYKLPSLEEYNCAGTIARLLAFLGVSYEEARQRWLALSVNSNASVDGQGPQSAQESEEEEPEPIVAPDRRES